jgi:hypothetical protein
MTMNNMKVLIEPMLLGICNPIRQLSGIRLELFLEWLMAHCRDAFLPDGSERSGPKQLARWETARLEEYLKSALGGWFESLALPGLLWEYHLILNEVSYWLDLDPRQLARLLESERQA